MYDIIIIGAGPAGLTAGIFARRSNKKTLILEANNYGGQIINTPKIENYPAFEQISGFELANKLYNQAINLGVNIEYEKVIEIKNSKSKKEVITDKNLYECKAIIIATGAENRKLNIDREDFFLGKGISYCATCDGNFYKNKDVAVIGGKNVALEDTIYLSNVANKVYLINKGDSFKADQVLIDEVNKKKNVDILLNSNITSLIGDKKLEGIKINDDKVLNISGLFIALARIPENENFRKVIELDKKGFIVANEDCHTNVDGIFAAGDTRIKELRQLVTATSDGAIAATEAIKYINKK